MKMESSYKKKSMTNRIYLKRQLYSLRMKQGTNVVDHLKILNTLMWQFTTISVKIKGEDKTIMLLCTLLESWDHLVITMSYSSIDSLEFNSELGDLLFEEMQRMSNSETSTSKVFMAQGRKRGGFKRNI